MHPEAARYIDELERHLRDLPGARRREIIGEIEEHIREAAAAGDGDERVHVRTVLDQLGDPETIADDARERFGITPRKGGVLEGFAIFFLLLGAAVIPVIGWFLGVALLWISKVWSVKDKLIGTFVIPGGLAVVPLLFLIAPLSVEPCTEGPRGEGPGDAATMICSRDASGSEPLAIVLMVVITLLPVATSIYLGRRAFRR
jgi:uncharacterized membrane protein